MLQMIVAMTKNRVIGKKNDLPWHISDDLKRFKKMTSGQTVIMGKNTYDSIGFALPNRKNIVLHRSGENIEGVDVCQTIPEAMAKASEYGLETFVIGGASVYEQMLPLTDVLHISYIKEDYEGDILFPEFDKEQWRADSREDYAEFEAVTYKRIKETIKV